MFQAEIDMVERFEVKVWNRSPFFHFHVIVFVLANGNWFMYQVWKVEQNLVGLLLVVVNSCFDRFDLIRNCFSLFQEWCDILAFLPRGLNALRDLVSSFSETVGLGLFSAPVCVQL